MSLWAIVPVKAFAEAKSRLAGVLSDEERIDLSRRMLVRTLEVLGSVPEVDSVLVVSADPQVHDLAAPAGAIALREPAPPDLNRALSHARVTAQARGAASLLIVAADLPRLAPDDVRALVGLGASSPSLVIAPDRHRRGTNGLKLAPPALLEFQFGPGSFARHVERGRQAGAEVLICNRPGLSLDLDTPQDLETVRGAELLSASLGEA
jgi:2-phospho-L-lactate guanylyltransferase